MLKSSTEVYKIYIHCIISEGLFRIMLFHISLLFLMLDSMLNFKNVIPSLVINSDNKFVSGLTFEG